MKVKPLYLFFAVAIVAVIAFVLWRQGKTIAAGEVKGKALPPVPPPPEEQQTSTGTNDPDRIDPSSPEGIDIIENRMRNIFSSSEYPILLSTVDLADPFPPKMSILGSRLMAGTGAGSFSELPYKPESLYPTVAAAIEEVKGTRDKDLRTATEAVRNNYFAQLYRIFDVQFLPGWSETYNQIVKPSGYADNEGDPTDDWNRFFIDLDSVLDTIRKNMKKADQALRNAAIEDYQAAGYTVLGYA